MYLITLFCGSWPSFSFLYLLFSTPASFRIKNLPQLCFPHWSQFCCLHTHTKYFCYYCYLDNLGPATYRGFSSPGPAWPWKILLPCSYLSGLAISYNSFSATCEIQPVLMDLLSASHTGIQHIQQFLTSGSFSLNILLSELNLREAPSPWPRHWIVTLRKDKGKKSIFISETNSYVNKHFTLAKRTESEDAVTGQRWPTEVDLSYPCGIMGHTTLYKCLGWYENKAEAKWDSKDFYVTGFASP